MKAVIYRFDGKTDVATSEKLSGKYLLKPVHDSTMADGEAKWDGQNPIVLRFFDGSSRAVIVAIVPVATLDYKQSKAWHDAVRLASGSTPVEVGRFAWENKPIAGGWEAISMFIRDAKTLTLNDYKCVGELKVAADAKGFAIFSTRESNDRALRILVAYSLGLAYHHVLEQAIDALAVMTRGKGPRGREEAMYTGFSRFLAGHYFDEPARVTTTEVGPCYALIRERLHLRQLRDEATEQLSRIADIGRLRQQSRVTWLGIFIAFVGLLQVTQTTPAQMSTFARGWWPCIAVWSDAKCVPEVIPSVTSAANADPAGGPPNAMPLSSENKTPPVRTARPKAMRND